MGLAQTFRNDPCPCGKGEELQELLSASRCKETLSAARFRFESGLTELQAYERHQN